MRLGFWWIVALAGTAGCLTTNPALTDSSGDTEGDDTSATEGPTGSAPTTDTPTSGPSTSATSTSTDGPTTDGPTTDPDTTDTEGSGTTSVSETDTGPAACGGGNVCAPEPPVGWSGPVIWAETPTADEPPACPAAYPEPAFSAFDDLQAPPAECGCECGDATGARCASITLEYHGTEAGCLGGADETFSISPTGSCNEGPSYSTGRYWQAADPGVTDGSCTPSDSVMIPEAAWAAQSTLCGGATASQGECLAGETCLPGPDAGFESRLCVWQPGQLDCPDGSYEDRFVRHGDFADERNCSDCTCGDPTGDCTGSVVLRSTGDCSGATPSLVLSIGGSCSSNVGGTVLSASASSLAVEDVSCAPAGGDPIGEAEPVEPYTLCCMSL